MTRLFSKLLSLLVVFSTLCLLLVGCDSTDSEIVEETTTDSAVAPRAVYLLTNSAGTNAIQTYTRDADGALTFFAETPTGGSGSGDNLESSGNALFLDSGNELLYAVNAGSNSISAFFIRTDGTLELLDTVNSGGVRPVSIASQFDTIYVLNRGDGVTAANIAGFRLIGGQLISIDNSNLALSTGNAAPTQIGFSPSGTILTISESASNVLTTFEFDSNLAATNRLSEPAAGQNPSGFDYTPGGILVCAESNGNQANGGSVSSYQVGVNGSVSLVSGPVASSQTGTCCVKVLSNGLFALVSNPGSSNISVYSIASDGSVSATGTTITTELAPTELTVSENEDFLYVLNRDSDSIGVYQLDSATGGLTLTETLAGLPASAAGMAGR